MRECSAPQRTCRACPDLLPGIAKPDECSSLPASQPCFLNLSSKFPAPLFFGRRRILGHALALYVCQRAFGVPSIYQPGKTPRPSEFPVFAGFFEVFVDESKVPFRSNLYMLRLD